MNWTELLKSEIESAYATTSNLLDKVDPGSMNWKPATGANWMTMGQLLMHISNACGAGCRGFVTGDWGLPPGMKMEDIPPEEMLPPAEKLPTAESLEQVRDLLANDKAIALQMVAQAGERDLEKPADSVLEVPSVGERPARVVSYSMLSEIIEPRAEELLERAWDENADPFTNAVRITVSALRKRLGGPQLIVTVPGVGYRIDPGADATGEGDERG